MSDAIGTADTVKHGPTGEKWLVAYVQGDRLAWCGWPEGEARLEDCELVKKATPEQRMDLLKNLASMQNDGPRKRYAVYTLTQEVRDEQSS